MVYEFDFLAITEFFENGKLLRIDDTYRDVSRNVLRPSVGILSCTKDVSEFEYQYLYITNFNLTFIGVVFIQGQ